MLFERAFTLMETLVALFILAILMAASFPVLHIFTNHVHDQLLQGELLQSIELAKFESITRNLPIAVCKSKNQTACGGDGADGEIVFIDKNADGVVHNSESILAVIKTKSHHGNLYWRAFPSYRQYLLFSPTGLLHSDNGTFWHCHAHSAVWAVIINKLGRTRLAYPDNNGVIKDSHGEPLSC